MAFAEDAFEADRESLRTLDLDDHRIYVRGAPAHLLAVKCKGSAPVAVDRLFDDELIRVLGDHQAIEQQMRDATGEAQRGVRAGAYDRLLGELAYRIEEGVASRTKDASSRSSFRTLRIILWLVGLPLLALLAWQTYVSWVTRDLQTRANGVIAGISPLSGYPVKAHVERGARRMWVSGLVPDDAARHMVLAGLEKLAPTVEITHAIGVIPRSDVDAKLGAEGLKRAVERARSKLAALASFLAAARDRLLGAPDREALMAAEQASRAAGEQLATFGASALGQVPATTWNATLADLRSAADRLAALAGADPLPSATPPIDPTAAAESLALVAERITTLVAALEQHRNVVPLARRIDDVSTTLTERTAEVDRLAEQRLTVLDRRLQERLAALDRLQEQRAAEFERRIAALAPRPPTPLEALRAFIATNALFFSSDTTYRDPAAAAATLDALAPLVKAAGGLLRTVGYTDEVGDSARNSPLSQARAEKVAADLVKRGVPAGMLVAVGRVKGLSIAPGTGPESGNRRVEFEIGFRGERNSGP